VDAEINVTYMELNSGAKMADGKYRKTFVAGSVDRENTVCLIMLHEALELFTINFIQNL
jgi:hypothetical protein